MSTVYLNDSGKSFTKLFLNDLAVYNNFAIADKSQLPQGTKPLAKRYHEFRDPIHTFIRAESAERAVIDSDAFQRLRNIHQLSLSYLVYPGATHKRFEHCLGVMELAGRVYDVVTDPNNVHPRIHGLDFVHDRNSPHWQHYRTTVRMAALCHDLGHLPFSHGPEDLLPIDQNGIKWTHERLGYEIINSPELSDIWVGLHVDAKTVAKLSIGQKECASFDKTIKFDDWENILSEIVTGNALGVDRMDYLLRDSHHAGVAYGKFDHYRLIDTIRILPKDDDSDEPFLGIEYGGLPSAEQMLLARYFMFTQVYFHSARRAYDLHLVEFLKKWLPGGKFPIDLKEHQSMTDNEVLAAIYEISRNPQHPAYIEAIRITNRQHFKVLWFRNPADKAKNIDAIDCIYKASVEKFGSENIRKDAYQKNKGASSFPVQLDNGRIADAKATSDTLSKIPLDNLEFILVSRESVKDARKWLQDERNKIIHEPGCDCKGESNGQN